MTEAPGAGGDRRASARFAWLVVILAGWILGGVMLVVWAGNHGLVPDVGASPYHVPAWLGLAALALTCGALIARSVRAGRPWRTAFPTGYGALGVGSLVLLAFLVIDVAWREGVGINEQTLEGSVAPSRAVLLAGLVLVAVGPLRAALLGVAHGRARWAAIPSAALALAVLSVPGGLDPILNPWLERAPFAPQTASEVWVMDADGGHQTRLIEAADGTEAGWPAWSPDGRWIAYAQWTVGDPPGDVTRRDVDVWVAAADGSQRRLLVGGEGWQWMPRWSPDGQWIAYTQEVAGGPWLSTGPLGPDAGPQGQGFGAAPSTIRPDADIWRIRADGTGTPERLTGGPGDDRSAGWSPDGTQLVFDSTRDGNTELYVVNADGSSPRRLTTNPAEDWAASWSPVGNEIAFTSTRGGDFELYIVDAAGGEARPLTDGVGWAQGCAWSPDGTTIVMSANRDGQPQIWSLAADGTGLRNLSRSPGTVDDMWDGRWARDGRIVFGRSGSAPPWSSDLVRDNLAAALVLLHALMAAGAVIVVLRIAPPFGAFGLILGLATLFPAAAAEQWRFVPAGVVTGLAADIAVRYARPGWRPLVGAMTAAGAYVLALGVAAAATTGLAWSTTMFVGLTTLAGTLGGVLAIAASGSWFGWRDQPTSAVSVAEDGPADRADEGAA